MEVKELQRQVELNERVLPVGGKSKTGMIVCDANVEPVDVAALSGVVAYDPSEFLITSRAGTTIAEIQSVLAERSQYLPFDPLFSESGATLGGTIASGLSGPRQMMYGTARDFVMEVSFVDGLGQLVRGGGRVVKNAAGFDFPKMMVGSYGRFGIITDATLKVLPKPSDCVVVEFAFETIGQAIGASQRLLAQPLPITAVEISSSGAMSVEFAGLPEAIESVRGRAVELLEAADCGANSKVSDFLPRWHQTSLQRDECLIKLACNPSSAEVFTKMAAEVPNTRLLGLSAAGKVAWVISSGQNSLGHLDRWLRSKSLSGVVVRGPVASLTCLGSVRWMQAARRVQQALDPNGKFLPFGPNIPTLDPAATQ